MNYDEEIQNHFENILRRIKEYSPNADFDIIAKAFDTANNAHKGVKRVSGEPYIFHPIGVVETLCDLELDDASVCAGFLHDVVEDVEGWSIDRIRDEFNDEIAKLVSGLTKLSEKDFATDLVDGKTDPKFNIDKRKSAFAKNAANMRKIFLAMGQDLRVMVIKLADRLHNMKTLGSLSEERQKRMARETIQIFAPIAHRLGVYTIKSQLEDLSFKYLYPEEYYEIREKMRKTREERSMMLEMCVEQLKNVLKANNIEAIEIQARAKNFWSIRNKMIKKKCAFEDIMDLLAMRVIVRTQPECYLTLGVVHETWIPIPGEVNDYICKPKPNGYKSLHTKVLALDGDPIEVQIRTQDMHTTAEMGVAAHWKYKEGTVKGDVFERKMSWLRQRLFDWQRDADTSEQFFDTVVNDLFAEQVFIFTPRGDVIDLKAGSTPIDFAYRIHSNVGDHCVGAKVSGKMVPLDYELQNGDIVEIISRANAAPSKDWLNFVKTDTAKSRIRYYFKHKFADMYENLGRELTDKEIQRRELDRSKLLTQKNISAFIGSNYKTEKDLFIAIGFGTFSAQAFVNKIVKVANEATKKQPTEEIVRTPKASREKLEADFNGINDLLFTRGRCCEPLPGEEIIGYVTRGKGITMHSKNCSNIIDLNVKEPERLVDINWKPTGETFPSKLRAVINGHAGVVNSITSVIAAEDVMLSEILMKEDKDKKLIIDLVINVKDYKQYEFITSKIKALRNVTEVMRPVSRT